MQKHVKTHAVEEWEGERNNLSLFSHEREKRINPHDPLGRNDNYRPPPPSPRPDVNGYLEIPNQTRPKSKTHRRRGGNHAGKGREANQTDWIWDDEGMKIKRECNVMKCRRALRQNDEYPPTHPSPPRKLKTSLEVTRQHHPPFPRPYK